MKYVEVVAAEASASTLEALADKVKASDFRFGPVDEAGMQQARLLVHDKQLQFTLDTLQSILGAQPTARITVLPVEAALPKPEDNGEGEGEDNATARESLYQDVARGARLDVNYFLLVMLSTVVAAIGLIEDNIAVLIGAMVIAPLLGPNLALSLGTALGDWALMRESIKALVAGVATAVGLATALGALWPGPLESTEILARTDARPDSIALALASGAAATLSLTTGLSGVLVGVMVAVALLPPAVVLGITLGGGRADLAIGAGLLLAINIVCVNLSSKVVFYFKGMRPRTWFEKEQAKRAMIRYVAGWCLTLAVLSLIIYLRSG